MTSVVTSRWQVGVAASASGVLHRDQVAADKVVEALGEALQVDIGGVDERRHLM